MKKSELTQMKILTAAERLFREKSVDKVPVSDIAKEAGVAKGTVYLYFEAKEDIVWALMDLYLGKLNETFGSLDLNRYDYGDAEGLIDAIIDFVVLHKEEMLMLHNSSLHNYLGIERMQDRYEAIWKEPIKTWLSRGVRLGYFSLSSIDFYVTFIYSSFHGVIDEFIMNKSEFSEVIIRKELKNIIRKLLG